MDIRQIFTLVQKWAWLVVVGAVLGVAGGYVYTLYQPTIYQTTTKVMVSRPPESRGTDYYYIYSDLQLAKTYTQLIVTQPVLEAVGQELGFSVNKDQVSVKQMTDMLILDITVKDSDPARAQLIANTLIKVFIEQNELTQTSRFITAEENLQRQIDQIEAQIISVQDQMAQQSEESLKKQQTTLETEIAALEIEIRDLRKEMELLTGDTLAEKEDYLSALETRLNLYQQAYQQTIVLGSSTGTSSQSIRQSQLQTTLALYQQIYSNLLNNYESIRLARLQSTTNVIQIESAPLPTHPVQPQPVQNLMLGLVMGLALAGGIAFLVEYLDDTLKTPEDVARALKLPTIGLIGEMEKDSQADGAAYVADQPRSPIAEAFRALRTNLEFASVDKPLRTILVTSSGPSEGKTTVAINLAMVIAQGGKKVALLDADLRRPSLHQKLNLANRVGLTDLFRHNIHDVAAFVTWGDPEITVIPSGEIPPNPTELLASERMTQILDQLSENYDVVILDSPPSIVTDPVVLSARVDGVIMIIEPGKTKIDSAQAMLEQLHRSGARILGVVLNPIARKAAHYYGKYRYSSYYYYSHGYNYSPGKNGSNGNGNHKEPAVAEAAKERSFFARFK